MSDISELSRPSGVEDASRAMEIARIWIVDKRQQVVLSGNLWDHPAAWGLMLVDLAKHVANAYANQGHDRERVLARVREALDAEWLVATSDVEQVE